MKLVLVFCCSCLLSLSAFQPVHAQQVHYGLTRQSTIYIRSYPADSSEIVTQTLMGMPVKLLSSDDGWTQIVTPEGYTGFCTSNSVVPVDRAAFHAWNSAPKVIVTDYFTVVRGKASQTAAVVSDVVWGNLLLLKESKGAYYCVQLPDGRTGFLRKSHAQRFDQWLASRNPTPENLVETAKKFLGFPYFWGGISTKGVDCSGFTKMCYFLNGVILLRDAWQQATTGDSIDISHDYSLLQPGDLLFFGSKQHIGHVGMYIGNNQFIHSSSVVHISSLDPEAKNYDKYNTHRLVKARRIITQIDKDPGIVSVAKHAWYTK